MGEARVPRLLYHYTKAATAIEHILGSPFGPPEASLRLASLKGMNDPRETEPLYLQWCQTFDREFESGSDMPGMSNEHLEAERLWPKVMIESPRIVCFAEDRPDPLIDPPGNVQLAQIIPGWAHDRMWAQYADNHKGICLFFDRERLIARFEQHFHGRNGRPIHGPVFYRAGFDEEDGLLGQQSVNEVIQVGPELFLKQYRDRHANQLYFTKNPDWASEAEYRLVWLDDDYHGQQEAEYLPISGCLDTICIGARFPEVYEVNIRDAARRLRATIKRIVYYNGQLLLSDYGPHTSEIVDGIVAQQLASEVDH